MKIKDKALRATSLILSFALVQLSFGPEAIAQVVQVTAVPAPVGGVSGAAGSASNAAAPANAMALQMPAGSLTGSPIAAIPSAFMAAPQAAMSLPISAISNASIHAAAAAPALSPAAHAAASAAPTSARSAAPALAATPAASTPAKGDESANASAQAPAAAPAVSGASEKLESGPRTAGIGARMSRRVAELKNFLSGRRDAGAMPAASSESASVSAAVNAGALRSSGLAAASKSSGDKVSQSGGDNAPPAPAAPASPEPSKKSKAAWFGLGAAGISIIAYALTMQVGLEAQGVAMPQLTQNAFKDFTLLPLVTVFASIGSMIGQPMSKFFTEKFGLAKTFYAAHALRALSLGAMVVLFGTGMMSMPLMMAFYFMNGIVTGVAATAEGTLKKLILTEKGVTMQSFRTWWQLLAESLAVPAPIIFGGLVATLGVMGAPLVTAVYPVTILLGLILAYILHVYPLKDVKKASAQAAAQAKEAAPAPETAPAADPAAAAAAAAAAPASAPAAKTGVWTAIKSAAKKIFSNMEEGKNFVMSIPYLKYSLMGAVAFDLFNILIYRLIAPGYGKMTGGEAGLSAVQGNIVGMFSLGGLLLSVVFITMESMAKKKAAKSPLTPEAAAAAERSSMLRWFMVGIPALALLGTMALHIALPFAPLVLLGTNWMPSSVLAAALVPFGFFQVAASIKMNSYFQEKLPQDAGKVQKALAFSGSVMTALSILTILAMRPLFTAVSVFNPFPWLAMALLPIGVGLFFLRRKLASATTPEAMAAADAELAAHEADPNAAPKATGGYVGLILGIVAAAVVITALPMIPGVGAALAALSVLMRFGVNLGLTLLIPVAGYLIGRARGHKAPAKNGSK
ncbi:MAG TPA: hypothetical protein VN915_01995 [Elusimicrobiota bacterium]|nr:hypothetical protein [Elusimicrobiota bacterium]